MSSLNSSPPPATGVRLQWSDLPARLRQAVEEWLGSRVRAADTQPMGFSPGVAARLTATGGRRVFLKAIGPEPNPDSVAIHRQEAAIVQALPATASVPRLLWYHDDRDSGWVLLLFEDVQGWHPAVPWRADELNRVLDAMARLERLLTPSPIPVPTASEQFARHVCGWQRLAADLPANLDAWSLRHLDALAALEASAPEAVAGDMLLHFDTRADNILLTPEQVYLFDWPHACVGAAWVDLVGFAPSVAMQGGPEPEELLRRYLAGRAVDPGRMTAAIVALAGYFTSRALLPPPPGLPTLRVFQAAQGEVARRWVARRTGLD